VQALRDRRIATGRIIELGCGSGISSQVLAEAGFDVLGYDLSRAQVAIARKRVPGGQFRVESYLTASLPPASRSRPSANASTIGLTNAIRQRGWLSCTGVFLTLWRQGGYSASMRPGRGACPAALAATTGKQTTGPAGHDRTRSGATAADSTDRELPQGWQALSLRPGSARAKSLPARRTGEAAPSNRLSGPPRAWLR
jgi:Methyltransferase domain